VARQNDYVYFHSSESINTTDNHHFESLLWFPAWGAGNVPPFYHATLKWMLAKTYTLWESLLWRDLEILFMRESPRACDCRGTDGTVSFLMTNPCRPCGMIKSINQMLISLWWEWFYLFFSCGTGA
jgi:hypothetical protein